jgi:hypothetical protein
MSRKAISHCIFTGYRGILHQVMVTIGKADQPSLPPRQIKTTLAMQSSPESESASALLALESAVLAHATRLTGGMREKAFLDPGTRRNLNCSRLPWWST